MVRSCMELPGQKYADRHFGFLHLCGLGRRGGEVLAVSAGEEKNKPTTKTQQTKHFPLVLVWVAQRCAISFFDLRIYIRRSFGLLMSIWLGFLPSSETGTLFFLVILYLIGHEQWEGNMSLSIW